MFTTLKTKPFWINLLAVAGLFFLIIFLVLQLLGWITRHGEYLTVPAVKGRSTNDAVKMLEAKGFEVVITDSVYTDTLRRGTVIKQIPDANATVKVNRTVFITVNRYVPPMIVMPSLEGKGLYFAIELLQRNHLQLGDTSFKPDFMRGAVIEQQHKGMRIAAGAKVQWGSTIDLIVASGLDEEMSKPVPDFVGKTYGEVKAELEEMGVLVALVALPGLQDTASGFIVKQRPPQYDENKKLQYIKPGMVMDIFVSPKMISMSDSAR